MASKDSSKTFIKTKKQLLQHKVDEIVTAKQQLFQCIDEYVKNALEANEMIQEGAFKNLRQFRMVYNRADVVVDASFEKLFEMMASCGEDSGGEDEDDAVSFATDISIPSNVGMLQSANFSNFAASANSDTSAAGDSCDFFGSPQDTKKPKVERKPIEPVDDPVVLHAKETVVTTPEAQCILNLHPAATTPTSDVTLVGVNRAVVSVTPCENSSGCQNTLQKLSVEPVPVNVDLPDKCEAYSQTNQAAASVASSRNSSSSENTFQKLLLELGPKKIGPPKKYEAHVQPNPPRMSFERSSSCESTPAKFSVELVRANVDLPEKHEEPPLINNAPASVASGYHPPNDCGILESSDGPAPPQQPVEQVNSSVPDSRKFNEQIDEFMAQFLSAMGLKDTQQTDNDVFKQIVMGRLKTVFQGFTGNHSDGPTDTFGKAKVAPQIAQPFLSPTSWASWGIVPPTGTDCGVPNDCSAPAVEFTGKDLRLPDADLDSHASSDSLLPTTQLDEGSTLVGIITHLESPSSFYLQPLDADCDSLTDSLSAFYNKSYRSILLSKRKVGMLCCALCLKSNTWMRGIISAIKKVDSEQGTENEVSTVRYVDFGWSENLPLYRLRPLDKAFLSTPCLIVHCTLFGVEPPQPQTTWNEDQVQMFDGLTSKKTIKVVVREINGSKYGVDLYEMKTLPDQEIEICISDCLSRAKCCRFTSKKPDSSSSGEDCESPSHKKSASVANAEKEGSAPKISFQIAAAHQKIKRSSTIFHDDSSEVCNGKYDASSESSDSVAEKSSHRPLEGRIEGSTLAESLAKHKSPGEPPKAELVASAGGSDRQIPSLTLPSVLPAPEAMLSIVVSPCEFYVHPVSEEAGRLDELVLDLKKEYAELTVSPAFVDRQALAIGSFWCARCSQDSLWYRAKLLDVREVEETCKTPDELSKKLKKKKRRRSPTALPKYEVLVFFIDYGDKAWISTKDLRRLKNKFYSLPALAVRCRLAHIYPKGSSRDADLWPPAASEQLRLWAGEHVLKVQVLKEDYAKTGFYNVLLWNFNYGQSENLFNHKLVELGMADSDFLLPVKQRLSQDAPAAPPAAGLNEFKNMVVSNGHESDEMEQLETWNPMVTEHNSLRNSYNVDVDDPGVALTGHKAQDERDICLFIQRGQICKRGEVCRFKHIKPRADGVTTDKKEVAFNVPPLQLPKTDTLVGVEVTAVISPTHFYVTFPLSPTPLNKLMEEDGALASVAPETLLNLRKKMQEAYGKSNQRDGDLLIPATGEIVVAKFSRDEAWYRAKVVDVRPEKNLVKVFYVDYGNTEWMSETLLRKIQPEFMHLPFQAVECQLAGIELTAATEDRLREATDFFCRYIENTHTVARIVDKIGNVLQVDLFNTSSQTGINLNLALANKKYVRVCGGAVKKRKQSSNKQNDVPNYLPV